MADDIRGCPFCELNAADVVATSEYAVAFRDRYPVAEHHTLVIPRRHVASLFELDAKELADVWALVAEVRWSLAKECGIKAFNVGLNDGTSTLRMVTAESQAAFLTNPQRLLSEGNFVATYKYSSLPSLADISVERGDDEGSELEVPTAWIAEKFIAYYLRQTTPFVPKAVEVEKAILLQNTGRQAVVVNKIIEARPSPHDDPRHRCSSARA